MIHCRCLTQFQFLFPNFCLFIENLIDHFCGLCHSFCAASFHGSIYVKKKNGKHIFVKVKVKKKLSQPNSIIYYYYRLQFRLSISI